MNTAQKMILFIAIVSVLLFASPVFIGCTRVEPGYTGIKVNLVGSQRGADDLPVVTGWVFYNRFTTQIHSFPTFTQNIVWTKDPNEGSPIDESITFNSVEGAIANADIALSYTIRAERVPHIFIEIRRDIEFINHTYMRSRVRDAFTRHASTMKVVDIFGARKGELLDAVKKTLNDELKNKGFDVELVAFTGKLRLDPQVEQSINATISATQRAIEAQNKVVQSKAEAEQKIAQAEGEAQSILKVAQARAESNKLLRESLTSELLMYQAVQKWNGVTPMFMGDTPNMLLQLPNVKPQSASIVPEFE